MRSTLHNNNNNKYIVSSLNIHVIHKNSHKYLLENSFTHHYSLLIIIRLIFICACRHHLKLQSAGLYLLPRTIKLWITLNTTKLPKVHVVAYNTYTLHTYTPKRIYTYIHTASSFQESLIIKKGP